MVAHWAIPAVLALAAIVALGIVLRLLSEQYRGTALRCALGLWIAGTLVILPVLLSRS